MMTKAERLATNETAPQAHARQITECRRRLNLLRDAVSTEAISAQSPTWERVERLSKINVALALALGEAESCWGPF